MPLRLVLIRLNRSRFFVSKRQAAASPVVVRLLSLAVGIAGIWGCSTGDLTSNGVDVESIVIAPASATVALGGSLSLIVEVRDADGQLMVGRRVTWSTEDASIADVSSNGVVTGKRLGTVMIAASAQGKDAFTRVTVNPTPVASVRLSALDRSMLVGEVFQLTADPLDEQGTPLTGRPVTLGSSNVNVATITSAGLVTAIAPGAAIISASAEGKSAAASITVSPVPVASVHVTPASSDLVVGQNAQLTAVVRAASGALLTGRVVTWTTNKAVVATVSSSGVVTAHSAGAAVMTATSEGHHATVAVTVSPRPVSSVIVSPGHVNIAVGQTAQLNASVTDDQGHPLVGRPVSYSSSSSLVATVSAAGLVTGVSPGSVTITATSEGRTGTMSVSVAPQPVASVWLSPTPASVNVGTGIQLSAVVASAAGQVLTGRSVAWRSGAPDLASVSATGFVTGLQPGTAVIIATVEGISGSATITVRPLSVATVTITPPTTTVVAGQTVSLAATTRDASGTALTGRAVAWSSSDVNVATVSASGVVVGVTSGSVTITAISEGQSGTATVTVNPGAPAAVASVAVAPTTVSLGLGATVLVTATPSDAAGNALTGRAISWVSANPNVATVSASGLITATGAGNTSVTATSEGRVGTVTVSVALASVATVTIAPLTASTVVGQTVSLTATPRDASGTVLAGRVVAWSSSNVNVATVSSSSGVVTGVTAGSATITATSEGRSGTATVTVSPAAPATVASVSVAPAAANLIVGGTQSVTATPRDAAGNALTGRAISWASANPNVATVSVSGLITATGAGNTSVTATSEGRIGTVTVAVAAPSAGTVSVSPTPVTVNVAWAVSLAAIVRDANGNSMSAAPVTWSTSNASVAVVSSSGVVTGVAPGVVTITARSGTASGTASVTVQLAPVNRIVVTPANPQIDENDSIQLTATLYDANNNVLTGRAVTWSSSTNSVATVNSSGRAQGKKEGQATITASSGGKSGSTVLQVDDD